MPAVDIAAVAEACGTPDAAGLMRLGVVDLRVRPGVEGHVHEDGTPYPVTPRRSA